MDQLPHLLDERSVIVLATRRPSPARRHAPAGIGFVDNRAFDRGAIPFGRRRKRRLFAFFLPILGGLRFVIGGPLTEPRYVDCALEDPYIHISRAAAMHGFRRIRSDVELQLPSAITFPPPQVRADDFTMTSRWPLPSAVTRHPVARRGTGSRSGRCSSSSTFSRIQVCHKTRSRSVLVGFRPNSGSNTARIASARARARACAAALIFGSFFGSFFRSGHSCLNIGASSSSASLSVSSQASTSVCSAFGFFRGSCSSLRPARIHSLQCLLAASRGVMPASWRSGIGLIVLRRRCSPPWRRRLPGPAASPISRWRPDPPPRRGRDRRGGRNGR